MSTYGHALVIAIAIGSCSTLVLACAATNPPAASAATVQAPSSLSGHSDVSAGPAPTASDILISDEIRNKCGISDADAYFSFDSASVTSRDRTPLDLVANCFTGGPLKGRAVKLIGRADPRGLSDYNMTLGQSRADAVEVFLTARGMQKSQAMATSRGAMDAVGHNEDTWQRDRRVDVVLAD
jgi:peptidoglycan-associated lipoprotein